MGKSRILIGCETVRKANSEQNYPGGCSCAGRLLPTGRRFERKPSGERTNGAGVIGARLVGGYYEDRDEKQNWDQDQDRTLANIPIYLSPSPVKNRQLSGPGQVMVGSLFCVMHSPVVVIS